ncbi:hypothetical protein [Synoicihabitans lomoniglobus]|uniref:hypothetical protein n=1 Tax=Synoicihabitans lomoniglobus TaxID=2909285 RepID=UPI002ED42E47|nr:hypothetical protein [Opitutaceae bacterium LMO-M01]
MGATADALIGELDRRADVAAVIMFGSRTREGGNEADQYSDMDLQVITSRPDELTTPAWIIPVIKQGSLRAWAVRDAFGGVKKVSILCDDDAIDLVIVPLKMMRKARLLLTWGMHRRRPKIRRQFGDIVLTMGGGHRVIKGGNVWENFFARVVAEVPEPRIPAVEVENLAALARVDLHSIESKLARGELRAAQRWLHVGLMETLFKLMHELKRRRGERSFHDARRAESTLTALELDQISVSASLDAAEIAEAARKAAHTIQSLRDELRG